MSISFRSLSLLLPLTVLLAAASGLVPSLNAQQAAVQAPSRSNHFKLFGTFFLEVDGAADSEARLYHNEGTGGVLVRSSKIETPFQLIPKTGQVEIFKKVDVIENPDGSVQLANPNSPFESRAFQIESGGPRVDFGSQIARLKPKPDLLGPHDAKGIIAYNAAYRVKSDFYQPQETFMTQLEAIEDPVHVKIFFGTWCSICSELMPHILRVERDLTNPNITFEYYGVARDSKDPETTRNQISSFPTGLIFRKGEQVGRVESFGWRYPAMAVVNSLSGATARATPPRKP